MKRIIDIKRPFHKLVDGGIASSLAVVQHDDRHGKECAIMRAVRMYTHKSLRLRKQKSLPLDGATKGFIFPKN